MFFSHNKVNKDKKLALYYLRILQKLNYMNFVHVLKLKLYKNTFLDYLQYFRTIEFYYCFFLFLPNLFIILMSF